MKEKENNNKKVLVGGGIGILTLLILTVGATYAYFTYASDNQFGSQSINAVTEDPGTGVTLTKVGEGLTLDLKAIDMVDDKIGTSYHASGSSESATIGKIAVGVDGLFNCTYTMTISKSSTTEDKDLYTKFQNMSTKSEGQIYLNVNEKVYDFNTENLFPITYSGEVEGITKDSETNITANLTIVNTNVDQTELNDGDISLTFEVTELNCEIDTYNGPSNGRELLASPNDGLNTTTEGGMYRYQGTNEEVNNHICFGTSDKTTCIENTDVHMYRIIGITYGGQLKLIKKEALSSMLQWFNYPGSLTTWVQSDVYKALNSSMFLTNTTYVPSGWSDKIATHLWYYGDNKDDNVTALDLYRTENAWTEYINSKVGLMYAHDYAYGLSGGNNCSVYGTSSECKTSWLHLSNNDSGAPSANEWTMSRYGYSSSGYYHAWHVSSSGYFNVGALSSIYSVRPVFFLTNDIEIIGGTGQESDPFIIKS